MDTGAFLASAEQKRNPGHWMAHLREMSTHKPSVTERKNTAFYLVFMCVRQEKRGEISYKNGHCFAAHSVLEHTSWQRGKSGCLWGSGGLASSFHGTTKVYCVLKVFFLKYFWDQLFSDLLLELFTRLRLLAQSYLLHNTHPHTARSLPSPFSLLCSWFWVSCPYVKERHLHKALNFKRP